MKQKRKSFREKMMRIKELSPIGQYTSRKFGIFFPQQYGFSISSVLLTVTVFFGHEMLNLNNL